MVDSIKITALQDIGANIAYTTLVPLVNMAGTPTTQKSNLQNLGNLILNGAGGSYFAPAARAISSQAVTNAAQPNITSVGTLTSLAVTGNITAGNINGGNIVVANFYYGDGGFLTNVAGGGSTYSNSNVAAYLPTYTGNVGASNVNVTGTVYANGISSTGLASLTTLNVSATANLGAVGNVRITGGTSGQKLTTDGTGNLTWTNDANSSYGNSNVATYLPTFTGTVGANRISSNNASGSNLEISANGAVFMFGQGGALYWPTPSGQQRVIETNIDGEFEIKSTTNVVISTDTSNANSHFTFAGDGAIYCPANAFFEGTRLNVGPGAGNLPLATNPTLVVTDTGLEFIQTALINQSSNGSSDYVAYGADSDEVQGFADLGFAGHTFNDPNYTITNPGDGYILSQGYANGIGGGLVLATGENGNVPDIVFATGGFLANAEFARIDHTNNMFHLTRANSFLQFAGTGSISNPANTSLDPVNPNVSTMTLTPDANYNSQVLVLDPTAPGHIHLRAYAFSNIDEPAANIFLGGEDTAFEITSGANNQAVIHSNGKAWTFGDDGNISSDTLTFTTTYANYTTTEYQTAGIWEVYVDDFNTGPYEGYSRINVTFKDNQINKPQVYIENQAANTGVPYRWTFDENGNLNLPGNTVAINFANGTAAFGNTVEWTTAPVANTSAGTAGQAAYDSGGNLYVCVTANTWAKFAGTTSW